MADDIVRDFLRRVRELYPETQEMQLRRLEVRLRQVWGGERVYVTKAPTDVKSTRRLECLAAGASEREAIPRIGVSRVTAWRLRRHRWVLR
mgnify:CR=1 FL=1